MVGSKLNNGKHKRKTRVKKATGNWSPLVFFPLVSFSQVLYYLYAWNRLEIQILTVKKNLPGLEHFVELLMIVGYK